MLTSFILHGLCRISSRDQHEDVDVSHEAQIRAVESSFEAANASTSLSSFRHPTKPSVRAVETYEVLPDWDTWANAYDLFKFSERPGDRNPEVNASPHLCVRCCREESSNVIPLLQFTAAA